MQFIEVSVTGVRSAVITLRARDRPQRIALFPMLHLGVTTSYRLPRRSGRLGLVEQRIDYSRLSAEVIEPDMTGRQLRAGWHAVPILQRVALLSLAPAAGAVFWLLGTRRMLARYAAAEDLPVAAEIMLRDKAQALAELLLDRRDALLAAALDQAWWSKATRP